MKELKNDFSKGSVSGNILGLALPMILAQLINVLYSVVDRMYIGHLPNASAYALTGVGLTFPVISIITAFANLFGMGGSPLFSIARGGGNDEKAGRIMGNSFIMLLSSGVVISALILIFQRPLLFLFGASKATYPYASEYLTLYLCGSIFVMISLGMNNFINAQGFGKKGMMTVLIGAVINILLDPVFIFLFNLGVRGAALATVISQFISALWAFTFLTGRKAAVRLKLQCMKPDWKLIKSIVALGLSGFIMAVTNSSVQIVCNVVLHIYGGDLYVGIMTIINSIREVISAPMNGITSAAQPVLGFNYGAKKAGRVCGGIKFMSVFCISYTVLAWICLLLAPIPFIRLFNNSPELIKAAVPAIHTYFFGFFMMSLQMSGQTTFVALGKSRQAVFFSLLRKVIIVIPLTILLPRLFGLGVYGVFLAEPVSNFIGGGASFLTMIFTVWLPLKKQSVQIYNK